MADYSGQKAGGNAPGKKKKEDESFNWLVLVILFAVGLWPIALIWIVWKWVFNDKTGKKPEEKIRQAREKFDSAVDSAMRGVANAGSADAGAQRNAAEKAGAKKTAQSVPQSAQQRARKLRSLNGGARALQVAGALLAVFGLMVLVEPVSHWILFHAFYGVEELLIGSNLLLAGGILLGRGTYLAAFSRRSRTLAAAIGDMGAVDVAALSRKVGQSRRKIMRDLEKMIDRGIFGEEAYLDREQGWFFRSYAYAARRAAVAESREETTPKEAMEGYSGILRAIRRSNDRIADEVLSAKIDRLEQITGQILRVVEEHPEKRAKMHTFFDYYLPTTQKLLDAYAEFEETGVEGENLREAKRRIEQTMDSIVAGFAYQLDQLYHSDAMDVASDIRVMETMLHRDGAGAAKDFGYDDSRQSGQ